MNLSGINTDYAKNQKLQITFLCINCYNYKELERQ